MILEPFHSCYGLIKSIISWGLEPRRTIRPAVLFAIKRDIINAISMVRARGELWVDRGREMSYIFVSHKINAYPLLKDCLSKVAKSREAQVATRWSSTFAIAAIIFWLSMAAVW